MAIKVGDRLPEATFRVAGPDGLETLTTKDVFAGNRVVLFAVPGAFTPTCHLKHLPGFIESADDFKKQGPRRSGWISTARASGSVPAPSAIPRSSRTAW